jgi:hypothetical protein
MTTEQMLYLILVFVIPVGLVSYYSLVRRAYRFIHRRVMLRRAAKKREQMRAERVARRARKNKKGKP